MCVGLSTKSNISADTERKGEVSLCKYTRYSS